MQLIREGGGDNWRLRAAKNKQLHSSRENAQEQWELVHFSQQENFRLFFCHHKACHNITTLANRWRDLVTHSLAHSLTDAVILSPSWILTHKSFFLSWTGGWLAVAAELSEEKNQQRSGSSVLMPWSRQLPSPWVRDQMTHTGFQYPIPVSCMR